MNSKVLLVGAYANGNLGDMHQADALAALVKEISPSTEVFSASPSKRRSAYPTKHHTPVMIDGILEPDLVNTFDALFVGGGGLLAAPHYPLNNEEWVERLKLPIFAVSLGVTRDTAEQSKRFVERCKDFSVRDEYSQEAAAPFRGDISIVMDPILLQHLGSRPVEEQATIRNGIVLVPGKLVDGTLSDWSAIQERFQGTRADRLVSFNPGTDQSSGFDELFVDVEYLDSLERFYSTIQTARFVMSERYHGCIAALAAGVPVFGICLRSKSVTSKIEELYRRIGLPQFVLHKPLEHTRASLKDLASNMPFDTIRALLGEERTLLRNFLARCLASV